ncbi:CRT10-domain-containing protein [Triangularia setosa]|uniref:CRT10-domain-containing protein n=1 Tax=Triangularia setosa TaxID=2587417 RepID=A0AAN6WFD6_9PEZI|nr:CRT10-domain-containing protein [Podospora setosa]
MMNAEADTQQQTEAGYDEVYVHPVCHVQTPESRFGPGIRESFAAHVNMLGMPGGDDFDDEEDDEDSDDIEAEDEDEYDTDDDGEPVFLSLGAWLLGGGMTLGLDELQEMPPVSLPLVDEPGAANAFPQTSTGRCNLTALSQRYNLYFAAYQDKIHVYQPQRAPRILPPPCLILHPGTTKLAALYPAELDRRFPHQINNMIVGNLGNLEIVLFAFDDGDVGAYYTHTLVHWIKTYPKHDGAGPLSRHSPKPKMFFHENVSLSAWGLAIHQQSRLIAVGSNRHEVTVFAFAFTRHDRVGMVDELDESPEIWTGQTALQLQKHFQSRTRTWKITLPLATSGHNIPGLSFLDDEHGNADKIAAIDIWGVVWLLDIWKIGTGPVTIPTTPDLNRYVRGWSVMAFPDSAFKPTKSVREALGLPAKEIVIPHKSSLLDITCGLYYIKDLAVNVNDMIRSRPYSNIYERTHNSPFGFSKDSPSFPEEGNPSLSSDWESVSGDSDSDEDGSTIPNMTTDSSIDTTPSSQRWGALGKSNSRSTQIKDFSDEVQLRREIIPVFGETPDPGKPPLTHPAYVRMCADRQKKVEVTKVDDVGPYRHLPKDFCLLRTSAADLELVPLDRTARRLTFKHILTFLPPQPGQLPSHHAFHTYSQMRTERVHLMLHVPELFLVVLGSEVGRVALVTLTKTSKTVHGAPVRRGFRVDCVLPRKAEEQKKVRPYCGLVGMAISPEPAQGPRAKGQLELCPPGMARTGPVVYRLILHYADHTILMYDLARGKDPEDELMIF